MGRRIFGPPSGLIERVRRARLRDLIGDPGTAVAVVLTEAVRRRIGGTYETVPREAGEDPISFDEDEDGLPIRPLRTWHD